MSWLPASALVSSPSEHHTHPSATQPFVVLQCVMDPSELLDFLSLPPERSGSCFSRPVPLSALPAVPGKRSPACSGKRSRNHVLFLGFLSCAPGKYIKVPAKFQRPLLTAWPAEVRLNTSHRHGDMEDKVPPVSATRTLVFEFI